MKRKIISCHTAKTISCLETLYSLGYTPKKEIGNNVWFLSPFREEKEASFKVNLKLNRWYDHGAGIGGNVIDLIVKLKRCTVGEALAHLSNTNISFSFQQPTISNKVENKIVIEKEIRIQHPALIQYLSNRNIKLSVANEFCKQIHYSFNSKNYFAIGLKNNSGGYELRNKIYKNSSSPKDITLIKNQNKNLVICEGMFDLLTYNCYKKNAISNADLLILNSISFIEKAEKYIQNYHCIELYLDRDSAGKKATHSLLNLSSKCIDMSLLYNGYNDLNEWWMSKFKK
ncbi:toprim domain-containing protein [Joostella sp. CR20]|uniref:toprim domain-containing protein n=1 Tax=Joostella sp. CR20 TaxID=2804312 RepID=UPI00313E063A